MFYISARNVINDSIIEQVTYFKYLGYCISEYKSDLEDKLKIVINDNIIEKVTDFKYLGYCISEYKSDLEDKLQTYNRINGAIRRHFGNQTNKETKLRIHKLQLKKH